MKAIVLAAGLGTRFRSSKPKVLHPILGKPMIWYVIDTLNKAKIKDIGVVVSHKKEEVITAIGEGVSFFTQDNPKGGTADAVLSALKFFEKDEDYILITNGDSPLITPETIKNIQRFIHMVQEYEGRELAGVVLTSYLNDPEGYGRILREEGTDRILRIVEEKDASPQEKNIREVNGGLYVFKGRLLARALLDIKPSPITGELYLPEVVRIMAQDGLEVRAFMASEPSEILGVNNRWELAYAENIIRLKLLKFWALQGVTIHMPESVWIEPQVQLSAEVEIHQGCVLKGNTVVEEGSTLLPYTIVEDSRIGKGSVIGPFARIRNNTVVEERAQIGNFVEVKNSEIGKDTKAKHLAYIGDAQVGEEVNIGAGSITANYDGKKKHKTIIERGAFIGSNSLLIAPIRIGSMAYIAGGSVISKDIDSGDLAVERAQIRIIKDKGRKKLQD